MTRTDDLKQRLQELSDSGDSTEKVDALNELADRDLFSGGAGHIFEYAEEAHRMAGRLSYASGEAFSLFVLGTANWLVTRLEKALALLLEADATFRELDDPSSRAKVRFVMGAVYRSLGDYDQAFLEGSPPVEFFQANGDHRWEARARLSLAMTCFELGDLEGALAHNQRVLAIREESNEQWIVGRALAGIGTVYDQKGEHRKALEYHLRSLKMCEAVNFPMGAARALHELGNSYKRLGDREKAIDFYTRSLTIREEIDQREAQCTSLIALGNAMLEVDTEKALEFMQRAREVAEQIDAKPRIYQAHLALSRVHEARGDVDLALEHFKAFHRVREAVVDFTGEVRVKNLKTVFEAEKMEREAEIARLRESLEEGESLGSYRLIERLGSGGMGEVWLGRHRLLARPAAVKVIRADGIDGSVSDELVKRFQREAEVTAGLRSPHTVQLFDFGVSENGSFYYVMELLDGMDLRELVERFGPLPPERAIVLLRQACRSLAEAHDKGLVHRDIKPANLFVAALGGEFDFLKVLDFGMVKAEPQEGDVQLTGEERVIGTPAFIAPELVTGEGDVGGKADLYSLGCTAFWALTGKTLFEAKTPTAMLMEQVRSTPPPVSRLSEQNVPEPLERAIAQCLEKRPEDRPASAAALWEQLGTIDCGATWGPERAREWWGRHVPSRRSGAHA